MEVASNRYDIFKEDVAVNREDQAVSEIERMMRRQVRVVIAREQVVCLSLTRVMGNPSPGLF